MPAAFRADAKDEPVACIIQNLSAGGAQIGTREALAIESRLHEIKFSLEIEGHPRPIEVSPPARVVYCEPIEGRSETFVVGIRFIDAKSDEIALVQKFVYYQLVKTAGEKPSSDDLPVWKRRVNLEQPIAIRFGKFDDFVEEVTYNLSATGMFIKSRRPLPAGTIFEFEFQLGEDFALLKGQAQVVWVRKRAEGATRPAGMGVHFVEIDESSRKLIERLVDDDLEASEGGTANGTIGETASETIGETLEKTASEPATDAEGETGVEIGTETAADTRVEVDGEVDDEVDVVMGVDTGVDTSLDTADAGELESNAPEAGSEPDDQIPDDDLQSEGSAPVTAEPPTTEEPSDVPEARDETEVLWHENSDADEDDDHTFELLDSLMSVAEPEPDSAFATSLPLLSSEPPAQPAAGTRHDEAFVISARAHETQITEIEAKYAARMAEVEAARADAEQKLIDARSRELGLRVDLEAALERAAAEESERDRLRAEAQSDDEARAAEVESRSEALLGEIATLRREVELGTERLGEAHELVDDLKREAERLGSVSEEATRRDEEHDAQLETATRRNDELEAELTAARGRIDELDKGLDTASEESETARREMEERSTLLRESQRRADELATEVARLTHGSEETEARVVDLDARAEDLTTENRRLSERLRETESSKADTIARLEKAERERSKKSGLLRDALARLETIDHEHIRLEERAEAAAAQLSAAEAQLEESHREIERLDRHAGDLDERLAAAAEEHREGHERYRTVDQERTRFETDLTEARTDLAEARAQIEHLEHRVAKLDDELAASQKASRDTAERARQLEDERRDLESELSRTRAELSEVGEREAALTESLETLRRTEEEDREQRGAELRSARQDVERRTELLETLESDLQTSRALELERSTELRRLEARERELHTELESARRATGNEVTNLREFAAALVGRIEALESDAYTLEVAHHDEVVRLRTELETAVEFARRELEFERGIEVDPTAIADLEVHLFTSESELESARAEVVSAHEELATVAEERARLQSRIDGSESASAQQLAEIASAAERAQHAEERRKAATAEVNRLTEQLERERRENDEMRRALEAAQAEVSQTADGVEAIDHPTSAEVRATESRIAEEARRRADRLAAELERRRVEARVLAGELESARETLAEARRKNAKLEHSIADRAPAGDDTDDLRQQRVELELRLERAERRASDADDRTVDLEQRLNTAQAALADGSPGAVEPARTRGGLASLLIGITVGAGLLFAAGSSPLGETIFGRSTQTVAESTTAAPALDRPVASLPAATSDAPDAVAEPPASELSTVEVAADTDPVPPEAPAVDLEATTLSWAAAWSNQDADAYLGFYGDAFTPPNGLDRATWEAQRRDRIRGPGSIRIDLGPMIPDPVAEDRILVRFVQSYATPTYSDRVMKTLDFALEDGRWAIVGESSKPLQ